MVRPTPELEAVRALFADGQWHGRSKLLALVKKNMAPERAYRKGYNYYQRRFERGDVSERLLTQEDRLMHRGYQHRLSELVRELGAETDQSSGERAYRVVKKPQLRLILPRKQKAS